MARTEEERRAAQREAERRYRNSEKGRATQKAWAQSERGKEVGRARRQRFLAKHGPTKRTEYDRRYYYESNGREAVRRNKLTEKGQASIRRRRWARYSLTVSQAEQILIGQDWLCAVAGEPITLEACHVDHDHTCCDANNNSQRSCGRCVRGLVCETCNKQIAQVERGRMEPTPEIDAYLARGYVEVA